MRILVSAEHAGPRDGVAVHTLQVARELARRGNELEVVYLNGGPFEDDYRSFAHTLVHVSALNFPTKRPWQVPLRFAPSIRRGVRLSADVVYDNLLWSLPWSIPVAGLSRAGLFGHMHGFSPEGPGWKQRYLMKHVVDRYASVSEFTRAQMIDVGVDPSKVTVIHNGIDADAYPVGGLAERAAALASFDIRPEAFVILFLGRIEETKGVDVLLDAVRSSTHRDEIELVFVGPARFPEYLEAVRRRSAGLNCHWRSEQVDVMTPLHAADVVVVPSLWQDPLPRVVIEALATGRPVVASRSGGIPEMLTGDLARFLFDRGDHVRLAELIDSLRNWRTDEPGLADLCVRHVRENFSITRMVDSLEEQLSLAQRPRR